jgi:hypothetical protein
MPKKKLKKTTKLFPFSPHIVRKNSEPKETFDEFKFRVEMMPFFLLIREYRIQCQEYGILTAKDENLWTDPVKKCWDRLLFVEKQMGDRYNSLHQQMECSNYHEDLAWEELYKERNKNNVKVFKKSTKQD